MADNTQNQSRDIQTISFGKACRTRTGMYLSSEPIEALCLGLREIYVNSLDALTETKQLKGNINIIVDSKTRTITVSDDGPGIPNKVRDDNLHSVVAAYTLSHTGSHFDGREVNSIGTNGVGGSIVNHTAERFSVVSEDSNTRVEANFESNDDGAQLKNLTEAKTRGHGVIVVYKPDSAIYGDAWLNKEVLENELSEMMKFYPRVKLTLTFDNSKMVYHYPNGLKERDTKMYYESDNLILALSLSEDEIKPFGNRLYLPAGGAFYTHFKSQMTRIVNDLTGLKLNGSQIQAVFGGYIAIFVPNPLFSNQSKTAISNKEVNLEITSALKQVLEKFSKTPEWERAIKELETELKMEIAMEKARNRIKASLDEISKGSRKKVLAADKLKDCINHGKGTYLAITEGDSAQGALNLGRDIERVATFPIRGKFINTLKNKQEDFLANEELITIAQVLGCGIFEKYNSKNLRYENVLIAVDADSDGLNIACLLITFFYVCMPNLIKEGRLYWMKAPLYYNDKGDYIFTEEDWSKVKSKKGFTRAKGIGEMTPKAVEESMFGASKCWQQLKPKNWDKFSQTVQDLMGKDVAVRKEFLFANIDFERIKFL